LAHDEDRLDKSSEGEEGRRQLRTRWRDFKTIAGAMPRDDLRPQSDHHTSEHQPDAPTTVRKSTGAIYPQSSISIIPATACDLRSSRAPCLSSAIEMGIVVASERDDPQSK
jgi:hypothetical protein